jgi:hypothetical protein
MQMSRRTLLKGAAAGTAIAFLPLGGRPRTAAAATDDQTIVGARIHPAIGIGRVGNSENDFFVSPEVPGLFPNVSYKDSAGAVNRQAAKFRIYGVNAAGELVKELTSADADIEWSVHLAAKKPSWYQWVKPMDIPPAAPAMLRNAHIEDRSSLIIDGGEQTIVGGTEPKTGPSFEGAFMGEPLYLGELRTDEAGRLLVLGGRGRSFSPTGVAIQSEAVEDESTTANRYGVGQADGITIDGPVTTGPSINSDEWTDDMSDGPVTAQVIYDGQELPVVGAWVAVITPNYAPQYLYPFRTLWDVITETMVDQGWIEASQDVSFRSHILPMFSRLSDMQWVNEGQAMEFGWGSPSDFQSPELIARLADASPSNAAFRRGLFGRFRNPNYLRPEAGLLPFMLGDDNRTPTESPWSWLAPLPSQYANLRRWADGDFVEDLDQPIEPTELSEIPVDLQGEALDRAALESVEGDAFHPAPELQFIMRVGSMYDGPYRIKRADFDRTDWGPELTPGVATGPGGPLTGAGPGDITKWGGLPWQLDVSRCGGSYQEYVDMFGPSIWPMRAMNGVLRESDYKIVMDTLRPLEDRLEAFFRRTQWLRVVRVPGHAETGANAVTLWPRLGFILPREGPGDAAFPETIFVETGIGFDEPEPTEVVRDVSIWIQQHLS